MRIAINPTQKTTDADIMAAAFSTMDTPCLSPSTYQEVALTVTELNAMISDTLESALPGFLWIEGEVSNFSLVASGHRYFSLKDSRASVSCALFKGQANRIARPVLSALSNGDKVTVKASVSVYQPRGQYQLIVHDVEPAGFGALAKAFAALKAKLDAEGVTAASYKKALPTWPAQIALVTSETGAAIRDVLTTLARRAPFIPVKVYPTLVQGEHASQQIVKALAQANYDACQDNCQDDRHADNCIILLVRGGGSLEDLQAFNDEAVAYAIVNSQIPVVTGVGHETDFTIADFVSDYRAPTPTGAAEVVSPDRVALLTLLKQTESRLYRLLDETIHQQQRRLIEVKRRLMQKHPLRQHQQNSQRLDELANRLTRQQNQYVTMQRNQLAYLRKRLATQSPNQQLVRLRHQLQGLTQRLVRQQSQLLIPPRQHLSQLTYRLQQFNQRASQESNRLSQLNARLQLLSPQGMLDRGFVIAFDEQNQVIDRANTLATGAKLRLRFADGQADVMVQQIKVNQREIKQ
ncbi:exodeoxyribonuclease VII large subunit [Ostreibacterium oceani]|uniref:Exodeoxyribonuclease 7 large subunit n=1 Tax=Ostreibacterium oceani TaxID=2654998 RepID=A0A6N7EYD0_9GAMM|nr:exodeoxyribonuclease VII large subunit [Ostreibacterium oceani]MPV85488.1 exodeoxyribonuclease VII large subunit [Ostreibacterium oceani]